MHSTQAPTNIKPDFFTRFWWLSLVITLLVACGSGSDSRAEGSPNNGGNEEPPEQSPPIYSINLAGGQASSSGAGGRGGELDFYLEGHGRVELRSQETVDASFEPSELTTTAGHNDLLVTEDLTIISINNEPSDKPEASAPYLIRDYSPYWLRISDGETSSFNNVEIVSGVHVYPGVTLEIQPNNSTFDYPLAHLEMLGSIINEGTITTQDLPGVDRTALLLETSSDFLGYPGSTLTTQAILPGQNGGHLKVETIGRLLNQGEVITSGEDGLSGGDGGHLVLLGMQAIENIGDLTAEGGQGSTGQGGEGGSMRLETISGPLLNAGALSTRGENGHAGGTAGDIIIRTRFGPHSLHNAGPLDASGGRGTRDQGGHGGDILFEGGPGGIRHHASVIARGGDHGGDDTSSSTESGNLYFESYGSGDGSALPGDVLISGNLDLSGGGRTGLTAPAGRAGEFAIEIYGPGSADSAIHVLLAGYELVDLSGGDGATGGRGGSFYTYIDGAGDFYNDAAVLAMGGTGELEPGRGGKFGIEIMLNHSDFPGGATSLVNQADVDVTAGPAAPEGEERAGDVWLIASGDITQNGSILAHGELYVEGAPQGNRGGEVEIVSENGVISVTGLISTRGGPGIEEGGRGAISDSIPGVYLSAQTALSFEGEIITDGGDAIGETGIGGEGGAIHLTSQGTITHSGTLSAKGGQGATDGEDAAVVLNGVTCLPLGQGC